MLRTSFLAYGGGLVAALSLIALPIHGATIVSVSGPSGDNIPATLLGNVVTSWTTTSAYSNVSINARLFTIGASGPVTVSAFLMNQLGPGTTLADQIAAATLPVNLDVPLPFPVTPQQVQLFSGLTIPAGSYYLLLQIDPAGYWAASNAGSTTTLAAGVSASQFALGSVGGPLPNDPYLPANPLNVFLGEYAVQYSVSGDPVPEPSTLGLAGSAIPIMLLACLRARRG